MEQMLDGNSAAELEYNGVTNRSREHRHGLEQLRRDRQEFIDALLGNGVARTGYKPLNEYYLWDAIDAIPAEHYFWRSLAMDGCKLITINILAQDDPDFIVELFFNGRLEEFRPLITEQVEEIANSIFIGWDDE